MSQMGLRLGGAQPAQGSCRDEICFYALVTVEFTPKS